MNEPLECRRKWCFKSGDFRPQVPSPRESWGAGDKVRAGCALAMETLLLVLTVVGDPLGLALDSASSSLTLDSVISGLSPTPIAAAVATSAAVPAPLWIPGISETECVVHGLNTWYFWNWTCSSLFKRIIIYQHYYKWIKDGIIGLLNIYYYINPRKFWV